MKNAWQHDLQTLPTEVVSGCLLCGGINGLSDSRWCHYLHLVDPYGVLRCPRCGLRWLSPRPNAAGYRTLYSAAMYFGGKGASPADYKREANARIGYWRARIRQVMAMVEGRCGSASILDYGAATGEFVRIARELGNDCVGLELSADARRIAATQNGVELLSPEQVGEIDGRQFDVVHMNHVLEHMPNPLAHLQWCASRLSAGGLIVLEVPQQFDNDLDRLRRYLRAGGARPQFDAYSLHHTYFFTPSTMARLLQMAGFRLVRLATFNRNKTPLWPPVLKNWILRAVLECADRLHRGGNIIEVYARVA